MLPPSSKSSTLFYSEDGGNRFLWNVSHCLSDCTDRQHLHSECHENLKPHFIITCLPQHPVLTQLNYIHTLTSYFCFLRTENQFNLNFSGGILSRYDFNDYAIIIVIFDNGVYHMRMNWKFYIVYHSSCILQQVWWYISSWRCVLECLKYTLI
jgi:hypothetical protein